MLTVQEIQAINFEKAVFGGYDMKSVDEFLEHITEDFATLQKENAALKSKMKVLVDKIEEYRSVEDGMRRALVSAQNIAQETLDKSKAEAEQLLMNARNETEVKIENFRMQIAAETKKLEDAKAQNSEFAIQLSSIYEEQIKSLALLRSHGALDSNSPESLVAGQAAAKEQSLGDTQPFIADPDMQAAADSSYDNYDNKESRFKITEVSLASSESETQKPEFDFGDLAFGTDYKAKSSDKTPKRKD